MADELSTLTGMGIGLLVLVVILTLGPGIGQTVTDAMPVNQTGPYAGVTTGADIWNSGTGLFTVVVTIVVLSVALKAIFRLRGSQ